VESLLISDRSRLYTPLRLGLDRNDLYGKASTMIPIRAGHICGHRSPLIHFVILNLPTYYQLAHLTNRSFCYCSVMWADLIVLLSDTSTHVWEDATSFRVCVCVTFHSMVCVLISFCCRGIPRIFNSIWSYHCVITTASNWLCRHT
jgi:hypothetical protein